VGAGRSGFVERAERERATREEKENIFLFIFQLKSPQTQILKMKMTFLERVSKTKVV
jgi:hypothetical protein